MSLAPRLIVVLVLLGLVFPTATSAFPFGGQITLYHVCYNETLFARLSPPVPGDYVWTTATRTYQFGPPRAAGQWLLGLTGIPFDCLWSVSPILTVPAIAIMMMGSSQTSFKGVSSGGYTADPTQLRGGSGGFGNRTPTYTGAPQYTGTNIGGSSGTATTLVISEVHVSPDSAHGIDPAHEWVELYNNTNATINVAGWTIQNASSSDTLPSGASVAPGSILIITQTPNLRDFWTISSDVRIAVLGSAIGNGLSRTGDTVQLRNTSGTIVDSVSWGTNTAAFTPAVSAPAVGQSLSRKSVFTDSNMSSDWSVVAPTPGE